MNLFRRIDVWQPSPTWWLVGAVTVALAVADLLGFGNHNREFISLGVIGFAGMVLEIVLGRRTTETKPRSSVAGR